MNDPKKIGNSIYIILSILLGVTFTNANGQYALVDDAVAIGTNTYRLTKDSVWQNGSAWNTTKINLNNSFDFYFDLYFGIQDGTGADGITFTLQQEGTGAGAAGQGLGAGGVKPSLLVEYDTYNNTPYDIPADHVAMERDGDQVHTSTNSLVSPVQANINTANIEDDKWHSTRVIWDAPTKTMTVYFDCELRLTYTGDIVSTIFGNNPNVFYGFTAATGGSKNEHRVRDIHVAPSILIKDTICIGSSIKVDLSGADTYSWTPNYAISNVNIAAPTLNPTVSTQYIVTVSNKCETWKDTVMIHVNPKPIVNLGPDKIICDKDSILLDAGNPGHIYKWGTTTDITQTVYRKLSGTYSVTVTDSNNCKTTDAIKITTVSNIFSLGPDTTICAGSAPVTFDPKIIPPASATYLWNKGEVSATISRNTSDTISVTIKDKNGCIGKDTVILKVIPLPIIELGADTAICEGSPALVLDAKNPGSTYLWSTSQTSQTISIALSATYSVTVTNANNCKASDAKNITVSKTIISLGADSTICEGDAPVTFDPQITPATYLWNTGETTKSISVNTADTFSVVVTTPNGCTGTDAVILFVNPLPQIPIGDTTVCDGETMIFNAAPYTIVEWNDGSTSQTYSASTAGIYSLDITDNKGCKNSGTATLTLNPIPKIIIRDTSVCNGSSVIFNAAPYTAVKWNDGSSLQTLSVSASGNYSVEITDNNGCKNSDVASVTIIPHPIVNLGKDTSICEGENISVASDITGTNYSYLWNTGATNSFINISNEGTYSITVSDGTCAGSDEIKITVIPFPILNLTDSIELCQGQFAYIDSKLNDASLTFQWSTGESTSSVRTEVTGEISLIAFYHIDCPAYDTTVTKVIAMPVSALGADTTLCFLDEPALSLNAGNNAEKFKWQDGTSDPSIIVNKKGTYSVTLTTGDNCTITDEIVINEKCIAAIYGPNAFTPNGDGINDVFLFKGIKLDDFHLMIFNRWGELLFESYDINKGWDGTYQGNPVQIDVYIWKIGVTPLKEVGTDFDFQNVGHVALIR